MNTLDSKLCLDAFNKLCDELSASNLASSEECQYWMFERGYKAALAELINNMTIAAETKNQVALKQKYLSK